MKYKLVCNGDSWVFGCEIVDPKLVAKHPGAYAGTYDYFEENINYRTDRIWTTFIREYLDCETVNISWPADDNTTILRRTIDYVTQEYLDKNKSTEELIVVVGWSSPERNSFWWKDSKINVHFRLWPHVKHFNNSQQEVFWKLYTRFLWHEEEYLTRYIMDNLTLQNFCIANNIKYLIYNSFYQISTEPVWTWNRNLTQAISELQIMPYNEDNPDTKVRTEHRMAWKKMWNQVKAPNFYKKDQKLSTFNEFILDKLENPYIGMHPSPQAHNLWAKELADYLKEHIITDVKQTNLL